MNFFKQSLVLIFYFNLLPLSYAQNHLTLNIEKKIKENRLKKSSLGLSISEILPNNKTLPLYTLNDKKLFTPASLVKIASLSALYHYYPTSYTFKTSFLSSAHIKEDVLQGHLVLKGGGDSHFTSESLWNLVNTFTRSGIKKIQGNLLIDDNLYKPEPALPYSERSYLSPTSASSFNWNSVTFHIRPGKTLKSPAQIFIDPENSYIQIINKVTTGTKNKIKIKRKMFSSRKEVFEIKGIIDLKKEELVKYRNTHQPALWLGYNTLAFLKQRNIKLLGKVKKGRCYNSCKSLAQWESKPFSFHSYNLMKYSSNFITRMLTIHLPLLKGAKKGDLRQGMKYIHSYLKKEEGLKKFRIKEPSGLSRKNRFSPKDLQTILMRSRQSFYSPEMLASYPLAGGQGTLDKRFPENSYIRAKTGSLYGVVGLAGFVRSVKTKKIYVFVFIFNGRPSKGAKIQKFFDELILFLMFDSLYVS